MSSMQTEESPSGGHGDEVGDISLGIRHNEGSTGTVPSSTFNVLGEATSLVSNNDLRAESLLGTSSWDARGASNLEREDVVVGLDYVPNSENDDLQQQEVVVAPVARTAQSEPNNGANEIVVVGNSANESLQQEIDLTERSERNGADEIVVVGLYAPIRADGNLQQEVGLTGEIAAQSEPNAGNVRDLGGLHGQNSSAERFQGEHPGEIAAQSEPNAGNVRVLGGLHGQNSSAERFQDEHPGGFGVEAATGLGDTNPGDAASTVVGRNAPNGRTDDLREEPALVPVEVVRQVEPNPGVETVVGEPPSANRADDFQQGLSAPLEVQNYQKRSFEEAAKKSEAGSLSQEQNGNDGDSLVCPICMEPWTNSGEHRICSLACGHLFGKSCIRRWMRQCGKKSSRCPHCNKRAKLEDLRTLYVPRTLAVVDGDAQQLAQELRALRNENARLKLENEKILEEVRRNKGKTGHLNAPAVQFHNSAGNHLIDMNEPMNITSGSASVQDLGNKTMFSTESSLFRLYSGQAFDSRYYSAVSSGRQDHQSREGGSNDAGSHSSSSRGGPFQLQNEVHIHGGKVFDMDAESLTVLFSNKIDGSENSAGLSKMSLLSAIDIEKIHLPAGLGAIRDIRISPSGMGSTSKCALVASTGRKLSLFSLESNNVVLNYSVQSPPWSCVWDPYVPNIFYSGLQNGALHAVDLRQTSSPLAVLGGPIIRPLHTLQVVQDQSFNQQANMGSYPFGSREILSASNSGISLWHLDLNSLSAGCQTAKPQSVFSDKEMLCISLAYESSINTAVASFRRHPSAQTQSSSSYHGQSPGQNSTQENLEVPSNGRPTAATGFGEPSHWIFSRGQESSWSQLNERIRAAEFKLPHERIFGEMVGNRSHILMPRTAIIPQTKSAPRSTSLFACGDEGTNSLWLWNMATCSRIDALVPHRSPILDVKNVQIQGKDTLGCLSEGTLQIYRRLPGSE